MRALIRERMRGIGYTLAGEWGAQLSHWRCNRLGATGKASPLLLQANGRRASNIGRIDTRMTRRCHLAASELMQSAKGMDVEELMPGFIRPGGVVVTHMPRGGRLTIVFSRALRARSASGESYARVARASARHPCGAEMTPFRAEDCPTRVACVFAVRR